MLVQKIQMIQNTAAYVTAIECVLSVSSSWYGLGTANLVGVFLVEQIMEFHLGGLVGFSSRREVG